jgi:transposase, IS5 family
MRVAYQEQSRLDCPPIEAVELNLKCRDEIIPILRALQHVYGDAGLRGALLDLVGQDVNGGSSRKRGRPGLDYWTIVVLAAVRLGCNFDYDKLQDLAEQHRSLRLMMGVGDWQEEVDFDWRRIRDNLCLLRPETLQQINQLVVGAGHALVPEAIASVRGDTFVVETNVHYPTESSLIGDGLRWVVTLAALEGAALRVEKLARMRLPQPVEERLGEQSRLGLESLLDHWPDRRKRVEPCPVGPRHGRLLPRAG